MTELRVTAVLSFLNVMFNNDKEDGGPGTDELNWGKAE
jgi:hypothetical protein